jgi:CheY-like chemotaxis protein
MTRPGRILVTEEKPRVLIVDDDSAVRRSMAEVLVYAGYQVYEAVDGHSALRTMETFRPDIILTDLNMPRMGGCELLSIVRRSFPAVRSIAMSGAYSSNEVPDGVDADAFFAKGIQGTSLLLNILADLSRRGASQGVPSRAIGS